MSRTPPQLSVLRVAAVVSAMGLVAGYAIFAQRQANRRPFDPSPHAKVATDVGHAVPEPDAFAARQLRIDDITVGTPAPLRETVMPGSKNGYLSILPQQMASPAPAPFLAPGSKSYVGGTVINGALLRLANPTPAPSPTPTPARKKELGTVAPGSKVLIMSPARLFNPAGEPVRLDEEIEEVVVQPPPKSVVPKFNPSGP